VSSKVITNFVVFLGKHRMD